MSFKLLIYEHYSDRFNYVYWNSERQMYYVDGERPKLASLTKLLKIYGLVPPRQSHQKQLHKEDLSKFVKEVFKIELE